MPISWTREAAGIVRVLVSDPYTSAQWRQVMDEILSSHPEPPLRILSDRRAATSLDERMIADMLNFLRANTARIRGSRVAVVVADTASFGMVRMLEIRADLDDVPVVLRVFRDHHEAADWLSSDRL